MSRFPIDLDGLDVANSVSLHGDEIDGAHYFRLKDIYSAVPEVDAIAQKRSREFYSGRWCAGEAIYASTGARVLPTRNSDRSPCWPKGVIGSITHTDVFACAAVAKRGEFNRIGIDLESVEKVGAVDGLEAQISIPSERVLFHRWDRNKYLALLFSAKESLFKAVYPEYGEYFDYLDAQAVGVSDRCVTLRLNKNLNDRLLKGAEYSVGYRFADDHVFTYLFE